MLHRNIWLLLCVGTAGCRLDDLYIYPDGGGPREMPMMSMDAGTNAVSLMNESQILAFLESKTLVMEPSGVPSHPNGFDANVNFGQATQCIHRVELSVSAGNFRLKTEMGTLKNAPQVEDVGECDRSTPSGQTFSFDTTSSKLENVRDDGGCFDLTLTYAGFGQEGRGGFTPDRTQLLLELFFRDQAVGHRCADGDVGDATITLNQEAFTGDAVQVYQVEE